MTASIKASADGAQAIIQVGGVDRLAIDSTTQFGNRNKIINGNFGINQRGVSGTVTLGAGVYGHDRWKAGSSGCTYTFATANNVTTITITAGSLMQVIEGLNLFSGTHILSWSGTAQGRVDSGSYGGSGVLGTAVGGTNQTIEFGTGTVSKVQYEQGNVATPFEHRPYGLELSLCQRYYETSYPIGTAVGAASDGSGAIVFVALNTTDFYTFGGFRFCVKKRTAPTMTFYNPITGTAGVFRGYSDNSNIATINANYINDSGVGRVGCASSNMTANLVYGFHYSASAEL